jgi:hypothetical protein
MLQMRPAERAALGSRARQRIREHFSLAAAVGSYEALYTGLAAGRPVSELATASL